MNSFRAAIAFALLTVFGLPVGSQSPDKITIDLKAQAASFPHFWEQSFGSGRAILSLRESYRSDLREVKKITDFGYVRFHAILHDELGVYNEDENGAPEFNFTYVGQVYDGLLQNGVRPIVEISFMPRQLASRQDLHPFWYKQIVSPPQGLRKVGSVDPQLCAIPRGPLRHRGGCSVVFRSLERAQHRFLVR